MTETDSGDSPTYLTTAEVAAELRVSTMTVRRWVADGRLTGFIEGRIVRVARADLDDFLALSRRSTPLATARPAVAR